MNLHKMIEICLKDDNMHIFVMINALICINNYVITCINSMLSRSHRAIEKQQVWQHGSTPLRKKSRQLKEMQLGL